MGNSPSVYLNKIKPVSLTSKVAIVTGANTGIGYITAREIAKMGATVFVACRTPSRADEAIKKMKQEVAPTEINVEFLPLDLASLSSVENCANEFVKKNLPLHILVNNAGVMALPKRTETEDGFETQIGVNHFGHFHLTNLLLPLLIKSAPSRVVNLSSRAHRSPGKIFWDDLNLKKEGVYVPWTAYGQSKLANILFTKELQRRIDEGGHQVYTYAVHPGFVKTELTRNIDYPAFLIDTVTTMVAKTVEDGSLTSIKTATDPDIVGKEFLGKYWADCQVTDPIDAANNMEDAKKLWELSVQMIEEAKKAKKQ